MSGDAPAIKASNATLFPSPMKNAKRGGAQGNYVVPDPPGLFDGHVWPMYLKHKNMLI